MSARSVLLGKLQALRDRKARIQADLDKVNTDIDDLVSLRDALSPAEEARVIELVRAGVLKVEE
jgi:hypothetical protein